MKCKPETSFSISSQMTFQSAIRESSYELKMDLERRFRLFGVSGGRLKKSCITSPIALTIQAKCKCFD